MTKSTHARLTKIQSLYSLSLNRRHFAYILACSALRLGVIMGLHLNISESQLKDRAIREHGKRVWWTLYLFERMWSSKLGHPVSISDDDIEVEPPSNEA